MSRPISCSPRRFATIASHLMIVLLLGVSTSLNASERFVALSYHDVRYDVRGHVDNDQAAVGADNLARHFQWLADHGFTPVSVEQIIAAAGGTEPLPERGVLLSFDDGYRSFYDIVFPLLKAYRYPAVLALVTDWLQVPYGSMVRYGAELKPREDFLSWEQIRELQQSGLVEIASHSHDLHRGIVGNPQGNTQPAATTRYFSAGIYEDPDQYAKRVETDLLLSSRIIAHYTGVAPRVMVWPFGAFTHETTRMAQPVGMPIGLTLEPGSARLDQLDRVSRLYIASNPDIGSFARLMYRYFEEPVVKRSIRLDLESILGGDVSTVDERLGTLLDNVKELGINTVVLKAFDERQGTSQAVYFPNRHLPVRADLLNRVAWQLRTRADIRWIYAWMPTEFDPLDEAQTLDVFEDLGRHIYLTGLFVEAPGNDVPSPGTAAWLERLDNWRRATGLASGGVEVAVSVALEREDLMTSEITVHHASLNPVVDEFFLTLSESATRAPPSHDVLRAFLRPLAGNREELVNHIFEVRQLPGAGGESVAAVRALLAAGAPSIGIFDADYGIDREMVEQFITSLSLRDHPYRP